LKRAIKVQQSSTQSQPSTSDPVFLDDEQIKFWTNLKDPRWRLNNLYFIVDKNGKKVKFKPNWAQEIILGNLWFFSIILKARQLGITTFFCILYLDQILFKANKTAGIIAHTDGDTKKIFQRIKYAWENLPELLKENIGLPTSDSVGEMKFPNGSSIFVARSTRGSTLQYLHISEFAKICAKYPEKAREIVTGAINSVEKGNFISIESTAEGKEGYFAEYCMEAQQAQTENKELSELDFKYFFFPWWQESAYRLSAKTVITKEYQDYFDKLEKTHQIFLDTEQKNWYIAKKNKNSEDMYREYPSTWEEAFMAQIEGAYYAQQMQRVYEDNRIRNVPYDSRYPVLTYWDLGVNDFNVILFVQAVGNEIRFIDCYYNHGEGLAHYVNVLKEKKYVYGAHTFPHDVEVQNLDEQGLTRRQTLVDLGMVNIRTVDRTKDINDDIEGVRKIFSRFYFDQTKCGKLIEACQNYKKEWDEKLGQFKNNPKHDKHSHLVDPLRNLARTWNQHMISNDKSEVKINYFFPNIN
tara:strand:- start:5029 stop:6597 length:1569 start_codon:yes stop_codon:yes gene_type:complete